LPRKKPLAKTLCWVLESNFPTGLSPTAGAITSTSTTARQVQFALKLLW
jgi:hypothetical protein